MPKKGGNISLSSYDDIFQTDQSREEAQQERVQEIKLSDLHADSTLAVLTKAEHMQGGNNKIWHVFGEPTEVHDAGNTWDLQRQQFWKQLAKMMGGTT